MRGGVDMRGEPKINRGPSEGVPIIVCGNVRVFNHIFRSMKSDLSNSVKLA